jgi:hypothetical protein
MLRVCQSIVEESWRRPSGLMEIGGMKQDVQDIQDDFKVLILFILYILLNSGLSGLGLGNTGGRLEHL